MAPRGRSVVCRRAINRDIPIIRDIAARTWSDTYELIIPAECQASVLEVAYSMSSLVRSIATDAFVLAEIDGAAAGFADIEMRSGGVLILHRLYVLPSSQRAGIGSRLLRYAVSRCLGEAFEIVSPVYGTRGELPLYIPGLLYPLIATVERDNEKGRAFYRKLGFAERTEETVTLGGVPLPVVNIHASVRKDEERAPSVPALPARAKISG